MNIIQEIQEKLISSIKPVARVYHQCESSKTMFIAFNSGMTLDQHKTNLPARLMVLTGKVTYKQEEANTVLHQYESKDIPADILHEVYADEDSHCMLIQG